MHAADMFTGTHRVCSAVRRYAGPLLQTRVHMRHMWRINICILAQAVAAAAGRRSRAQAVAAAAARRRMLQRAMKWRAGLRPAAKARDADHG